MMNSKVEGILFFILILFFTTCSMKMCSLGNKEKEIISETRYYKVTNKHLYEYGGIISIIRYRKNMTLFKFNMTHTSSLSTIVVSSYGYEQVIVGKTYKKQELDKYKR